MSNHLSHLTSCASLLSSSGIDPLKIYSAEPDFRGSLTLTGLAADIHVGRGLKYLRFQPDNIDLVNKHLNNKFENRKTVFLRAPGTLKHTLSDFVGRRVRVKVRVMGCKFNLDDDKKDSPSSSDVAMPMAVADAEPKNKIDTQIMSIIDIAIV